jgi:hypothetical protein
MRATEASTPLRVAKLVIVSITNFLWHILILTPLVRLALKEDLIRRIDVLVGRL